MDLEDVSGTISDIDKLIFINPAERWRASPAKPSVVLMPPWRYEIGFRRFSLTCCEA